MLGFKYIQIPIVFKYIQSSWGMPIIIFTTSVRFRFWSNPVIGGSSEESSVVFYTPGPGCVFVMKKTL